MLKPAYNPYGPELPVQPPVSLLDKKDATHRRHVSERKVLF